MLLSIFKMMLNAGRCSVLPSSTVLCTKITHAKFGTVLTHCYDLTER